MPGYVDAALKRFSVIKARHPTNEPATFTGPIYGPGPEVLNIHIDNTPAICTTDRKRIQEVLGVFQYYARAVDATMIAPIHKIASSQAKPTVAVMKAVDHFLQYAATYPNACTVFKASALNHTF
jgi:hypothetical protein